jgi:hypothetical protein
MAPWVIDRFEGALAVLASAEGRIVQVERAKLPAGSAEGDVIRIPTSAGGELAWGRAVVDVEATREAKEQAERILGELRGRDPGGDVVL